MAFDVSWIYRIVDRYTPTLQKIKRVTQSARQTFDKSKQSLNNMTKSLDGVKSAISGAAAIGAIAFPTSKAMAFEDAMIDVQKVVSFKTPDQFQKFREGVFKTAVATGKLPVNIAKIAFEGGKLGILPEKLQEFIALTARTSIAFDVVEGVAANTLGSIKTKMGLSVKATGDLMDAINFLADNTAASGKRVLEVVSRTTGTMKTIKMPPELVAGWAAFADQMEVSPELAASGLNMMVVRMMKMPGMMRKLLKEPNKAITDFLKKLAKMPELRRSRKVMKLFGDEAGRFALKAVSSLKLLDKTMGLVSDKTKFAGSMMKELTKKMAAASTSIGKIRAVADVVFIQLGDAILPIIKDMTPAIVEMTSGIRDFIKNNPGIIKMALAIGAIVAALAAVSVVLVVLAKGAAIFAGIMAVLASPIVLVVAAIAGLAFAAKAIYDNWNDLPAFFGRIWDSIVGIFKGAWKAIGWVGELLGFGSGEKTEIEVNKNIAIRSAENAALKGQINGRIEVVAKPGTEIVRTDMETKSNADVGLNMAEVY